MKKTALLAATATLAVSGLAHGQTNVILYGIADGNVRFDRTSIGTLKSVGSGGESSSRWGLRGTEDLGNGIKAVFNFEAGIDIGDNSEPTGNVAGSTPTSPASSTGSRLFGRRAIVGINIAKLGEVRIGREYTPFYQAWATADPFGTGMVGRATNIAVGSVTRIDNSITYESPAIYGLQAKAQYRPGESTSDTIASGAVKNGGGLFGGSLTYAQGPVYLGAGYLNTRNALDDNLTKSWTASGVYDFKVVRVHALFFDTRNDTTLRQRAYAAGLTVPIQAWKFMATVARIDNRYKNNDSPLQFNDALYGAIGGSYAFSRRTDVYSAISKFKNKGGAAFLIGDNSNNGLLNATNVPAGFDPWSLQFGVRHLF